VVAYGVDLSDESIGGRAGRLCGHGLVPMEGRSAADLRGPTIVEVLEAPGSGERLTCIFV
jgi:hypothetical protein